MIGPLNIDDFPLVEHLKNKYMQMQNWASIQQNNIPVMFSTCNMSGKVEADN